MTHTIGKMRAGGNALADCIKIGDELIGVIYPCEIDRVTEALANARRLAASWNACEGVGTGAIEVITQQHEGLGGVLSDLETVQKQRDTLLAALEQAADSLERAEYFERAAEARAHIAAAKNGESQP